MRIGCVIGGKGIRDFVGEYKSIQLPDQCYEMTARKVATHCDLGKCSVVHNL